MQKPHRPNHEQDCNLRNAETHYLVARVAAGRERIRPACTASLHPEVALDTLKRMLRCPTLLLLLLFVSVASGVAKPRARDLGIPFEGTPGPLNAITDVAGVEVGHLTLIAGHGK